MLKMVLGDILLVEGQLFKMSGHSFNGFAGLERTSLVNENDKNLFKTIYQHYYIVR